MNLLRRFSGELLFFETEDRLKTSGFLMSSGKNDVVVFLHGMGGNFYKDGFLYGAQELLKRGVSFFTFNSRGAEVVKDFRDTEGKHHLIGTALEKFEDTVKDIRGALNLLQNLGYKRMHLMGHSTGCQKILYYAHNTKDERIKTLIHLSPAEDYEIWKNSLGDEFEKILNTARKMVERGEGDKLIIELYKRTGEFWSAQRFLSFVDRKNWEARMFNYENLEIFSQITYPTLVLFGSQDPYFIKPIKWYIEKLRNAYQGKKLKIESLQGDHSFHGVEKEAFSMIANFIEEL